MRSIARSAIAGLPVFIGLYGVLAAADLNAPVNNTPTIGSEIARGIDAANNCPMMRPRKVVDDDTYSCIAGIANTNRQRMTAFEPFLLGLYFRSWLVMDVAAYPSKAPDDAIGERLETSARRDASEFYAAFRGYQKQLGVTDEQLIQATKSAGGSTASNQARLDFWASLP
jgi:hypothetical protein